MAIQVPVPEQYLYEPRTPVQVQNSTGTVLYTTQLEHHLLRTLRPGLNEIITSNSHDRTSASKKNKQTNKVIFWFVLNYFSFFSIYDRHNLLLHGSGHSCSCDSEKLQLSAAIPPRVVFSSKYCSKSCMILYSSYFITANTWFSLDIHWYN